MPDASHMLFPLSEMFFRPIPPNSCQAFKSHLQPFLIQATVPLSTKLEIKVTPQQFPPALWKQLLLHVYCLLGQSFYFIHPSIIRAQDSTGGTKLTIIKWRLSTLPFFHMANSYLSFWPQASSPFLKSTVTVVWNQHTVIPSIIEFISL